MIFFLTVEQVIEIHDCQLEEHGGLAGYHGLGAIDSIVRRVQTLHYDEGGQDVHVLGAAYLLAIAQGHGFNDANKRTALLSAIVFMGMNGNPITTTVIFADYVAEAAQGQYDVQTVASALRNLSVIKINSTIHK